MIQAEKLRFLVLKRAGGRSAETNKTHERLATSDVFVDLWRSPAT